MFFIHSYRIARHIENRLGCIEHKLNCLLSQGTKIMATLDQVLADVTAQTSQIASLATLTAGIKQQLADALAGTTIPPAVQAKIDAVFAGLEANNAAVTAAIAANTPPTPAPVPNP